MPRRQPPVPDAGVLSKRRYVDTVCQDGGRLATLAREADLSTPVPSTPDWDVGALIAHTGWVHRYATAWMAANGPQRREVVPAASGDLAVWFTEGLDALVAHLDGCDPDADVSTFVGEGNYWFWLRRMAHETAVHRWDAEAALGIAGPIATDVALDGIDEFLTGFHVPHRIGRHFAGDGETLHFHTTDISEGEWYLTRTAEGVDVERTHAKADVAARGRAQDLLLFLWSRTGPDRLEVFGDAAQLDEWQEQLNP